MAESNSPEKKNGKQAANGIGARLIEKIRGFQQSLPFKDLSEDALKDIAGASSFRHFKRGEFILKEGDPPNFFHLIFKGRVKLFKEAESGKHFIVNVGHPGDAVNSSALIEGSPHIVSAQALDDVIILRARREDFLALLYRHPSVALKIIGILHKVTASTYDRLIDLVGESAEQRICNVLYMLYGKFGSELRFTTVEIADLTGITSETVIRILSRLRRLHIIGGHQRGTIFVLDHTMLKNISRGPFLI